MLRLWTAPDTDQAPIELCGEKGTESWHYISLRQSARISFTTTDKTIGAAVRYQHHNHIAIADCIGILNNFCENQYIEKRFCFYNLTLNL